MLHAYAMAPLKLVEETGPMFLFLDDSQPYGCTSHHMTQENKSFVISVLQRYPAGFLEGWQDLSGAEGAESVTSV